MYDGRMNGKPDNSQQEQVTRTASGQLRPGSRLNPHGRPPGSGGGFRAAMQMLADIANSPEFIAAMQEEARRNPIRYARAVVLPLTPAKHRRELRQIIQKAEKAAAPFSGVSKTGQP